MRLEESLRPCQIFCHVRACSGDHLKEKKSEAQGSNPNQTFCITSFCNTLCLKDYKVLIMSDKWITSSHCTLQYFLCSWWIWSHLFAFIFKNVMGLEFYLQLYSQVGVRFPLPNVQKGMGAKVSTLKMG